MDLVVDTACNCQIKNELEVDTFSDSDWNLYSLHATWSDADLYVGDMISRGDYKRTGFIDTVKPTASVNYAVLIGEFVRFFRLFSALLLEVSENKH